MTSAVTVLDRDFHQLISRRARTLMALAGFLSQCRSSREFMVRPFLGEFFSQSMQMEELLDAYDARNNCQWCLFGSLIAAIKLFSDVSYELLHIQHALPAYRLLPIEHDFASATQRALEFTGEVLSRAAKRILGGACQLGLEIPSDNPPHDFYSEKLPPGRLPRDCGARRTESTAETVTLLATAFLNLASESKDVRLAARAKPAEYDRYLSDSIKEENLRNLELRFHNLQSLYDTHVSGTEIESEDTDLLVLRGHISVVFHLLKVATAFAHHYERHVNRQFCQVRASLQPLVTAEALLEILMNYSVNYISLYIGCAEDLCRQMLSRYAEVGQVEVSVPPYRGFHVRPATLIAKLALHYGSKVCMQMDNEIYDASSPLELFRANEKINAQKRRQLAAEIMRLELTHQECKNGNIEILVHNVLQKLVEQSRLILYEHPVQLPPELISKPGPLLQNVTDIMAQLLVMGKIDVKAELAAKFIGDKRVLADIQLLAESGYGEDNFGNNIPLPEKLAYLRR